MRSLRLVVVTLLVLQAAPLVADCSVPSAPSISVEATDPDAAGMVAVAVQYSFLPDIGDRHITMWLDGTMVGQIRPGGSAGTWNLSLDLSCYRPGAAIIDVYGTSCSNYSSPDYATKATDTVVVGPAAPTLSVTATDPDSTGSVTVSVTYEFPSRIPERHITMWLDGVLVGQIRPTSGSGTWSQSLDLSCYRPGTATIDVYGTSCGQYPDSRYATKATDTVDLAAPAPSVSVSATGPDPGGAVAVSVAYDFPTRVQDRHLTMWIDGEDATLAQTRPATGSGTWNVTLDLSCRPPGTTVIAVYGTSCARYSDAAYATKATAPVTVPVPKPELSLTAAQGTDTDTLTATYNFPNTSSSAQRSIQLIVDGLPVVGPTSPATGSGSLTANVSACWSVAKLVGVACSRAGDPQFSDEVEIRNTSEQPWITVDLMKSTDPAQGEFEARIAYNFGEAVPRRYARVERLAWVDADGTRHNDPVVIWALGDGGPDQPLSGQVVRYFNRPPASRARQLIVAGVISACSLRTVERSIPCDCAEATNDPVYLADGNMRLTDTDPLPPIAGQSLVRTYDSDEQTVALFGRGFTTLFEERVITNTFAGREIVSIVTADNEVTTFEREGSAYRQKWPTTQRQSGVLTARGGTYTYRAPGSNNEHIFRASDGKLTVLRDRTTGREATITYLSDVPQTLTDSWTGVTWTLTVQNRRVTSISIDGRPDLSWNYVYDANGNLTRVVGPGNATWRTYEYANDRMTASRDALGNIIETHDFDAAGYATSSTGPAGDEIQTIQYNLPGIDPRERVTRVTMKTGATTDHILRPHGGALRIVQVIGSCSACGGGRGDHTYVRD